MLEYVFIIVILIRVAGYLFDFIFILLSFIRAPFAFLFISICFICCSFCVRCGHPIYRVCLYSVRSFQLININTLTAAGGTPSGPAACKHT